MPGVNGACEDALDTSDQYLNLIGLPCQIILLQMGWAAM